MRKIRRVEHLDTLNTSGKIVGVDKAGRREELVLFMRETFLVLFFVQY